MDTLYRTPAWRRLRALALERDGALCTVASLGPEEGSPLPCAGPLNVCHVEPVSLVLAAGRDPLALEEVFLACSRHHGIYDGMVRRLRRGYAAGEPELGRERGLAEAA